MRFPSLRSETKSAALRMERWREIDGPEMEKRAAISPAARSRPFGIVPGDRPARQNKVKGDGQECPSYTSEAAGCPFGFAQAGSAGTAEAAVATCSVSGFSVKILSRG